jgi:hypothetical protein
MVEGPASTFIAGSALTWIESTWKCAFAIAVIVVSLPCRMLTGPAGENEPFKPGTSVIV